MSQKLLMQKKLEKTESKINWNENAKKIIAKINALNPNPGCWFELLMDQELKIIKAKEIKNRKTRHYFR